MAQYKYITKTGQYATIEAASSQEAISKSQNRDPASGVQLISTPTGITPTNTPTAQTPQQLQTQIQQLQQQVQSAQTAGYGQGGQYAGQNIPENILAGTSNITGTNINGINLPGGNIPTAGTSGVGGMIDYWKQMFAIQTQQAQDYQKQLSEQKTQQATQTQPWYLKALRGKSPEEIRAEATAQTGINPTQYFAQEQASIAELDRLNLEYNNKVAERDQAIQTTADKLAPMTFIRGEQALIQNQYNIELNRQAANINSKAATFQAKQGMFNEAQNFINNAVTAATAEQKYNMDMYSFFYDQNQDIINSLDTKYQNALQNSMTAAQNAWTTAVSEKTAVGELMVKPEYSGAGVTITDTLQEAQAKIARYVGTNAYLQRVAALGAASRAPETTGGATVGFKDSKIEADFRESGSDMLDEGLSTEEAYKKLRRLYSKSEVTDQAIKDFLGMTETPISTPTTPTTKPTATYSDYKNAGNGMFWTPEGGLIKGEDVEKDIQKREKSVVTLTGGQSDGWFSKIWKSLTGK